MMSLVVDSSVVIKWFVDEPYSVEAHNILRGYAEGRFSFRAPDLLNAEIGNILWKKHRIQEVTLSDAQRIIRVFRQLTIVQTSTADLLNDAYVLAVDTSGRSMTCFTLP